MFPSKQEQELSIKSLRGELLIASGRSGTYLAARVVEDFRLAFRQAACADKLPLSGSEL